MNAQQDTRPNAPQLVTAPACWCGAPADYVTGDTGASAAMTRCGAHVTETEAAAQRLDTRLRCEACNATATRDAHENLRAVLGHPVEVVEAFATGVLYLAHGDVSPCDWHRDLDELHALALVVDRELDDKRAELVEQGVSLARVTGSVGSTVTDTVSVTGSLRGGRVTVTQQLSVTVGRAELDARREAEAAERSAAEQAQLDAAFDRCVGQLGYVRQLVRETDAERGGSAEWLDRLVELGTAAELLATHAHAARTLRAELSK